MIKVAVAGCAGRMGSTVVDVVNAADDMELVCGIDPYGATQELGYTVFANIDDALDQAAFDVLVDFTQPSVVEGTLRRALPAGVDCVVGTTGLSTEKLQELAALAPDGTCLFFAPNFTTGAVLMMEFAKAAAPYFPEAEVIEMHHCNKKDAPSGTATRTAQIINEARGRVSAAPGKETEIEGADGARGALIEGVPVHSVRSMGFVVLSPQYVEGEQDWVYGITCRGRRLMAGERVSTDIPLSLVVGSGTYSDENETDTVDINYNNTEGDIDEFEEVHGPYE